MVNRLDSRDRPTRTSLDDGVLTAEKSSPALRAAKPVRPPTKWESSVADYHLDEVIQQAVAQMKITASSVDKVAKAAPPPPPPPSPPPRGPSNDDVLYVGTNDKSASGEAGALRGIVGAKHVVALDGTNGNASVDGYDLNIVEGRRGFVRTLGLTDAQANDLEALLASNSSANNPIAQIAKAWAPAERSGNAAIPSRLLISGHSGYGTCIGTVNLEAVQKLAAIMPNAAKQIEDVCLSGCSTAVNAGINQEPWSKAFPNLKTIWSYNGEAPSPGTIHFGAWAASTAGRREKIALSSELKAANVAVWAHTGGYEDKNESLKSLLAKAAVADSRFDRFANGTVVPRDAHAQPCDGDYRLYRKLSHNKALTQTQRDDFERKADALMRIRYYPEVGKAFAEHYKVNIKQAFEMAGMQVPKFEELTRAQAHAQIAELQRRLITGPLTFRDPDKWDAAYAFATGDLNDFDRLKRIAVPDRWFIR